MARPSKLNDELIKQFGEEIEDGLPLIYCCDLLSVSRPQFSNWIKQGEHDFNDECESLEAKFFNTVKKSYARYLKAAKRKIRKGEMGWQGEAWWLERTNKEFVLNSEGNDSQETVIVNPNVRPNRPKVEHKNESLS